jgi:hypothetical protein
MESSILQFHLKDNEMGLQGRFSSKIARGQRSKGQILALFFAPLPLCSFALKLAGL